MSKRDEPDFASTDFEAADFESAEFAPVDEAADDPLAGIEYTGDPEADSAHELAAVKSAFQERAECESKRREKATDSEFWICLCFQSRDQVEEFLRNSGWGRTTDKYLDGQRVAKKAGITITEDTGGFGSIRIDRKLADLSTEF